MQEAELVSELTITVLDGFRSTRASDLEAFYKRYDDEFPERERIMHEFDWVMNYIGALFENETIWRTFRRRALFFTLFCALYDAQYGLPGSPYSRIRLSGSNRPPLERALINFARNLGQEEDTYYAPFKDAASRSTTDPARRRVRHEFLWQQAFAVLT